MSEQSITLETRTVYSTEEFIELKSAVIRAGGCIKETLALRNGAGISCIIEFKEPLGSS